MVKQFSRVDGCRTCIFDIKKIFLLHISLQSKITKYPLDVMRDHLLSSGGVEGTGRLSFEAS